MTHRILDRRILRNIRQTLLSIPVLLILSGILFLAGCMPQSRTAAESSDSRSDSHISSSILSRISIDTFGFFASAGA